MALADASDDQTCTNSVFIHRTDVSTVKDCPWGKQFDGGVLSADNGSREISDHSIQQVSF